MEKIEKDENLKNKKEHKKKNKRHPLFYKIFSFLFIVLTVITFSFAIYNDIFPLNVLLISGFFVVLIVFFIIVLLNSKLRICLKRILLILTILIMVIEVIFLQYGSSTLDFIKSITDNGKRIDEYGIYVLKTSKYSKLEDLNDKAFGYLEIEDEQKIAQVIENIDKQIDFSYHTESLQDDLLKKLSDNTYNAIIMEVSREDLIKEENTDAYNNLKKITSFKIETEVKTIKSDKDITKDTFFMYISGIDTSGSVQNKARSDVNLIVGVNPRTKNILMVSTPRDYYVRLHSKGKMDKLTHSGIYGVEESLHTLEDLYDEKIDYYARVNFTSFVSVVNALEGIEVDVPKNFCEQNSKREFGDKLICLQKGKQKLNGEQALALARHRHTFATGDRARGENQMMILEAIINKAMSPSIITKYNSILNALDKKVSTNMTSDEMVKFIKKQMNRTSGWKFTKLSANGTDSRGACYSSGSAIAYVMAPDESTVTTIKNAIDALVAGNEIVS